MEEDVAPSPAPTKAGNQNPSESFGSILVHFVEKHPISAAITIIGGVASILGFVFLFFPEWYSPKRKLSMCVFPVRSAIVKSTTSDVSVSYKGVPVQGNVSVAQIAVWNAGQEPIRQDDILSPVRLILPEGTPILEIKPVSVTRGVIQFSMTQTNIPTSTVWLHWKVLEHNDGALIQVVYAGPTATPITMDGTIIGQKRIAIASTEPKPDKLTLFPLAGVIVGLVFVTGIVFNTGRGVLHAIRTSNKERGAKYFAFSFLAGVMFLLVVIWLYMVRAIQVATFDVTPFGF